GAVTLVDTVSAPESVTFIAGSLVQAAAADEVDASNLLIGIGAGNLGSSTVPFTFKAGTLFLSTAPSVNNAAQYLQAIGSVNVYPILDNTSGTTWLMGGTFVGSGLIDARAIVLAGGTLTGTGTVQGSFQAQGGTVAPGNASGVLTSVGNVALTSS